MIRKRNRRFPFLRIQQQRFSLHYDNQSSVADLPDERQCYRWIWHALKSHYRRADIALLLLDEDAARACNRDYRRKDYATNILSFALNEGETVLPESGANILRGDLVVCPQVVLREAAGQSKTPHDHFAHLLIHGTLHLIGFDHIDEAEAEQMEALETALLAQLGIADPYAAA